MPDELLLTETEAVMLFDLLWKAQQDATDENQAQAIFDVVNKLDDQILEFGYAKPEPEIIA